MQESGHFINYKKANLHYTISGSGDKILLTFHGYGQENTHYRVMSDALMRKYTIYSFDLFFHGKSRWYNGDTPLTKEFWVALIKKFLKENGIKTFSLAGFSMGGKFALATLEAFPKKVNEIVLIAPDGIKTSYWYSLNNYPNWLKRYMKSVIVKPKSFYFIMNMMRSLRVIDKGLVKFVSFQMDSREKRRRVYYTWTVFSKFQFNIENIANLINKHDIKINVYLGKYDKIITERRMSRFLNKIKSYELQTFNTGHKNLISHVASTLKSRSEAIV